MARSALARPWWTPAPPHRPPALPGETEWGEPCAPTRTTAVNHHGSPLNTASGEAAMRPGLIVAAKIEPEDRGELIAVGADRRAETHNEAVELLTLQPTVVERVENRLAGEVDGTAHQLPAKFRMA